MSGFELLLLSTETTRAVALGAVAGTVYPLVVFWIISRTTSSVDFSKFVPDSANGALAILYFYGGVWLTWAVPVALFVRFGTILPLGVALLELLLYAKMPDAGDLAGPLSMIAWPIYVAIFLLLAGAEVVSLQFVQHSATLLLARRVVVGGLFAGMLGIGLWRVLPVWRVVPVRKTLPLWVENGGRVAHQVAVEITDDETGEVVFDRTIEVGARDKVSLEDVVTQVGRYRVFAELDDGTTYEFDLTPRHFERFRAILVWVEGELGRLRVLGQGTGP